MPALPTSVSFTDSGTTEAQFKTAITNQREFLAGLLGTTGNTSDALDALGTLGSSTVTKSTAYTVISADRGALIQCTGTFTLSLTLAATLGNGFCFVIKNIGSGVITIDPSSTEQIDGVLTKTVAPNEALIVFCNGTGFYSLGSSSYGGLSLEFFTSNGTWTPPSGITKAFVHIEGGGGAGGSAQFSPTQGGRGGNGGSADVYLTSLLSSYSITIGSGGIATTGSDGSFNASGGTSSFGSAITCTGGTGGQNKKTSGTPTNGTAGTETVSSGTRVTSVVPIPFGTNYGNGGAGAINNVSGSEILGTSGTDGIVVVFY